MLTVRNVDHGARSGVVEAPDDRRGIAAGRGGVDDKPKIERASDGRAWRLRQDIRRLPATTRRGHLRHRERLVVRRAVADKGGIPVVQPGDYREVARRGDERVVFLWRFALRRGGHGETERQNDRNDYQP